MTIAVKQLHVVEEKTYTCDILFKEIKPEEVMRLVNKKYVISLEAFLLLPLDIQTNTRLLDAVCWGCGTKHSGFRPEEMKVGIWVIRVPPDDRKIDSCSDVHLTNCRGLTGWRGDTAWLLADKEATDSQLLNSVQDAVNMIGGTKYHSSEWFIFENGKLVRRLVSKTRMVIDLIEKELP